MTEVKAEAAYSTTADDELRTEYCCLVNGKQVVDVLMKLEANVKGVRPHVNYVLVIDVSGSMEREVGDEKRMLIDRVKVFAETFIQVIAEDDSLAIVSFSGDAKAELPATKITKKAKEGCIEVIENLKIRAQQKTNIEIGLITGVSLLKKFPKRNKDFIILFTDGEANHGELNASKLVEKFRNKQQNLGRSNCITLAALAICNENHSLVARLASELGNEAFYWLNEFEQFETDMLIPMAFREGPVLSQVEIEVMCVDGVSFEGDFADGIHVKESSNKRMLYFVHSVPLHTKKHIMLRVHLQDQSQFKFVHNARILEVTINFVDGEMKKREVKEFVLLSVKPLQESRELNDIPSTGVHDDICSYSVVRNETKTSWSAAQRSILSIADEKCRLWSAEAMTIIIRKILPNESDEPVPNTTIEKSIASIKELQTNYGELLLHKSRTFNELNKNATKWIEKIKFSSKFTLESDLGRLFAMRSSLLTEMPTAKGVFDDGIHPYMSPEIESILMRYSRLIEEKVESKIPRVFKPLYVLLSESLRNGTLKMKAREEEISKVIIRCGGTPVPYIYLTDTFLICSKSDFKKNTETVRNAKKAKIPIVKEEYVKECAAKKTMLDIDPYKYGSQIKAI